MYSWWKIPGAYLRSLMFGSFSGWGLKKNPEKIILLIMFCGLLNGLVSKDVCHWAWEPKFGS